jgi:hypothetical protein
MIKIDFKNVITVLNKATYAITLQRCVAFLYIRDRQNYHHPLNWLVTYFLNQNHF